MRSREDWERPKTNISGVFVVKLPGRGSKDPELALEIKSRRRPGPAPEEAEGTWSGRIRGFSDQRLVKLVEILEAVNPKAVRATRD